MEIGCIGPSARPSRPSVPAVNGSVPAARSPTRPPVRPGAAGGGGAGELLRIIMTDWRHWGPVYCTHSSSEWIVFHLICGGTARNGHWGPIICGGTARYGHWGPIIGCGRTKNGPWGTKYAVEKLQTVLWGLKNSFESCPKTNMTFKNILEYSRVIPAWFQSNVYYVEGKPMKIEKRKINISTWNPSLLSPSEGLLYYQYMFSFRISTSSKSYELLPGLIYLTLVVLD